MPEPDIPNAYTESAVPPRITLGSDPGMLLASLPALLGFTPTESFVAIGLFNSGVDVRAMRIGPVVRTDLTPDSITHGLSTLLEALLELKEPEVVLIGVTQRTEDFGRLLDGMQMLFADVGVGINGVHIAEQIATGETWTDADGNYGGQIADVQDNPLINVSLCAGALQMKDRQEREQWLRPTLPRLPLVDSGHMGSTDTDPDEAIVYISEVAGVLQRIVTGKTTLDEVLDDDTSLEILVQCAMQPELFGVLVVLSQGTLNPIIRDLLAQCVRRTRGGVRLRMMMVLAPVLISNDEGSLAFFVINTLRTELDNKPVKTLRDVFTLEFVTQLGEALTHGRPIEMLRAIVLRTLHYLTHLNAWAQDELDDELDAEDVTMEALDECATIAEYHDLLAHQLRTRWSATELVDDLDEAMDLLEWPAINRMLKRMDPAISHSQ